jgi:hypothetical protein
MTTISVNEKFEYFYATSNMVVTAGSKAMIACGPGGFGKTFTVLSVINKLKLNRNEYCILKTYATPRGFYNYLYDNNGKTIVIDDNDEMFKDRTIVNILKAALDSNERYVNWVAKRAKNDPYPDGFTFTGRIIFLTNLRRNEIPKTLQTRCHIIDLDMTNEEIIERMKFIIDDVMPEIDLEVKIDALLFIEEHMNECKELSLRTLLKVIEIRQANPTKWEKMAEYSITITA